MREPLIGTAGTSQVGQTIPPFVKVLILALLSHVLDLPWLPQHHLHSASILSADLQGPMMLLSVNTSLLVLYSKLGIVI
jgi:hypothetical protein